MNRLVLIGLVVLAACASPTVPSPSPSATASVSVAGELAETAALRDAVNAAAIQAHLAALQEIARANGGIRAAGTPGFDASLDYAAGLLRQAGYSVTRDRFTFPFFTETDPAEIQIDGGPSFVGGDHARAMIFSGSGTVDGAVTAVAVDDAGQPIGSGGCSFSDWAEFPDGGIALVGPGPCFRRAQVTNAQHAGAAAIVVSYPSWPTGQVRRPTLLYPDGLDIPAISASSEVGQALRTAAASGASVRLSAATLIEERQTANLIADRPGRRLNEVVMLGGHLDSVIDGPGINDNGSGTMTALEIALQLARVDETERSIRIGLWTGEESGLYGSRHYVDVLSAGDANRAISYLNIFGSADPSQIVAYLNLDMVASPNYVRAVYDSAGAPPGSAAITDLFTAYLDAMDLTWQLEDVGGASDHASFADAGIPVGGLFTGASTPMTDAESRLFNGVAGEPMSPCYHLACDTTDEIDPVVLDQLADAAAHVMWLLLMGA